MKQTDDTQTRDLVAEQERTERLRAQNAERQRRYKKRQRDSTFGDRPLSLMIDARSQVTLEALTCHYGCTKKTLIEGLLAEARDRLGGAEFSAALDTLDARDAQRLATRYGNNAQ